MTSVIQRQGQEMAITIGTTLEASTEIDTRGFGGGSFHLPAGSYQLMIAIYAKVGQEEYGPATDQDLWEQIGARIAFGGQPYPLPHEAFHYPHMKLVAITGDAVENVPVFLKA